MNKNFFLPEINKLINETNYSAALGVIRNALEENSNFYVYHEKLGDVYKLLNDYEAAIKVYESILKDKPDLLWIKQKIENLKKITKDHKKVVGCYSFYPDLTGKRVVEGGLRTVGKFKKSIFKQPLVTIVTAVYDNDTTFQRCIDSVKNQTYKNIEYIVIDGGSPKDTINLILKNQDFIDYFISEPDKGIYSAMNKGLSLANGDYICLLNSDDTYEPEFIEKSVQVAGKNKKMDVIYTDYSVGEQYHAAQPINDGVLFGHLNICHNTFLASKETYERVGAYDENYKIVSDAIWIRKAYVSGMKFSCISEKMFTLTEGGLSSGNTEARRELFINEVASSYRETFSNLSFDDAKEIYLFRFNKARIPAVHQIAQKYHSNSKLINALKLYVEYCFAERPNFRISRKETGGHLNNFLLLAEFLDIDIRLVQLETKQGLLSDILNKLDEKIIKTRLKSKKCVLHFVTVFSAPSETFIYDLLNRLEDGGEYDNFILYEHEKLPEERPFEKKIQVYWNDFDESVAKQIYKFIVSQLNPSLVVAHFALNEWKWSKRIEGLNISLPTISMCHGIDVFSLKKDKTYRDYILKNFSKRPDTLFTAVSRYLKEEMVSVGIPKDKINLLHNVVNPIFFNNRKNKDFYHKNRQLNILSVGRLVEWKGHKYLLEALAEFCEKATSNVHLTIVYGNGSECLDSLNRLAEQVKVSKQVTFESFVNFQENPEYYSKFDLFIHPSTYAENDMKNSETFGVAVLEAIAAGLPVISSNAGGLPEVIGDEATFAKVVPHADSKALANAMNDFWIAGTGFADNIKYAKNRMHKFSAKMQMLIFNSLIEKLTRKPIKAAIFSTSTIQGAGYAAYRLHRGLRETTIEPYMFTTVRNHENDPDVTVLKHPSGDNRGWSVLQIPPKPGKTIFTLNQQHLSNQDLLEMVKPFDIVNLHWHARFLSIENIAALTKLDKPVVMTIRDMMPITGGCHFFHSCQKWKSSCDNCPQIPSKYTEYPGLLFDEKRKLYNFDNLTIVVLSEHSKNIVKNSPMFKNCRIELIPNSIETDVFKPYNKHACREEFGLPLDRKIIGYVPSFSSEVKGYDEFLKAMQLIEHEHKGLDPFVMLVGNKTPATEQINLDKKSLGYINDNDALAKAYSCADVIVVPSLEETFSNTTAEAISCGVPVVGFKTGALPELILNGQTGMCVEVGNVTELANGVVRTLYGKDLLNNCRTHALNYLSFEKQAIRYEKLFSSLVQESNNLNYDFSIQKDKYENNLESSCNIFTNIVAAKLIESK